MRAHWNPHITTTWADETHLIVNPSHRNPTVLTLTEHQADIINRLQTGTYHVHELGLHKNNTRGSDGFEAQRYRNFINTLVSLDLVTLGTPTPEPFAAAHVLIFGGCTVGVHLARILADGGVGSLSLRDNRRVELSDVSLLGYPPAALHLNRAECSGWSEPLLEAPSVTVVVARGAAPRDLLNELTHLGSTLVVVTYDGTCGRVVAVPAGGGTACFECWYRGQRLGSPEFDVVYEQLPFVAQPATAELATVLAGIAARAVREATNEVMIEVRDEAELRCAPAVRDVPAVSDVSAASAEPEVRDVSAASAEPEVRDVSAASAEPEVRDVSAASAEPEVRDAPDPTAVPTPNCPTTFEWFVAPDIAGCVEMTMVERAADCECAQHDVARPWVAAAPGVATTPRAT